MDRRPGPPHGRAATLRQLPGKESAQTRRIFTVGTKNPIGPKRFAAPYGGRAAALTEENHLAADVVIGFLACLAGQDI